MRVALAIENSLVTVDYQVVNHLWDIATVHSAEVDTYATELWKQKKAAWEIIDLLTVTNKVGRSY